jgi:hypothetical protein
MESCGPGAEILVPMLTFVHDGRGTSINVLLHLFLRDARSSSFTASKHNWFYFTGDFGFCEFHFYGFFTMKIAVCFLEKVKVDMLYYLLYFR